MCCTSPEVSGQDGQPSSSSSTALLFLGPRIFIKDDDAGRLKLEFIPPQSPH